MQKFILATAAVSADAFLLRRQREDGKDGKDTSKPEEKPKVDIKKCTDQLSAMLSVNETKATKEGEKNTYELVTKKMTAPDCKKYVGCEDMTANKTAELDMVCGKDNAPKDACKDGENNIYALICEGGEQATKPWYNSTAEYLEEAYMTALTQDRTTCPNPQHREKEGSSGSSFLEGF